MRLFITGATGVIGSAVLPELLRTGHTVAALARSDDSARSIVAAGAEVVRGDLGDLDVLRASADAADGVVHLAFTHNFNAFQAAAEEEGRVVSTVGEVLAGSGRPFVIASGTPAVPGHVATEETPTPTEGMAGTRGRNAQALLDFAERDVRSAVVRLPRTVHNEGKGGFAGVLTDIARRTGVAGYPGDGTQRWPAVHAVDTAVLFRLALEQAPAGSVLHAVADEGDRVRDIVEVIGRRLDLPCRSVPDETFGPLAAIFVLDQPASSTLTRNRFDWTPQHPSLLDDLERLT